MAYPVLYRSRLCHSRFVSAVVTYRNIFGRNSFTQGSRFVARNLQASHPGVPDRSWLYRRWLADLLHIHDLYAKVSDQHRAYERSNREHSDDSGALPLQDLAAAIWRIFGPLRPQDIHAVVWGPRDRVHGPPHVCHRRRQESLRRVFPDHVGARHRLILHVDQWTR